MKEQFTNTFDGTECFSAASNLPPVVPTENGTENAPNTSGQASNAYFSAGFSDGCLRIW